MLRGPWPMEFAVMAIWWGPAVSRIFPMPLSRSSVVGSKLDHFFVTMPLPPKPGPPVLATKRPSMATVPSPSDPPVKAGCTMSV